MKVLAIAAHPDDIEIGCAGTLYYHHMQKDDIVSILLTSGELGCPGEDIEQTKLVRVHEAFEAAKFTGNKILDFWGEPDGGLQVTDALVNKMAKILAEQKPSIIYVTSDIDSHPDHKAAGLILKEAAKRSIVAAETWQYEIWTPFTTFDKVVDISGAIGMKLLAIRAHESQVKRIRFDEAALCLARFRGELHNRPHGPYAECFVRMKL